MTLIAGAVSRNPHKPLSTSVCNLLRRAVSRNPQDEISVFKDQSSFLIKLDIGAFDGQGEKVGADKSVTLVTGEPLLERDSDHQQSRETDTVEIHDGCLRDELSILRDADGVFSAAHYQPATRNLILIADKLGLRPLYFFIDDERVIFASALRILEAIPEIPKRMNVHAVTEIVGLGYALGERTPYADISLLRAGETVTVTNKDVLRQKYWHWDQIDGSILSFSSSSSILTELHQRFTKAVARRLKNDKTTVAYLSGGLDSRCIVAALREQSVAVHTFNFALPNTQDQVLGSQFARNIEAIHHEIPKKPGDLFPDYSSLMAESLRTSTNSNDIKPEHPNIVWSGEGGSVALGHVHLSETMVAAMRAGRIDETIDEYLERESAQVSPKLFNAKVSQSLSQAGKKGIVEELNNLHCKDAARNFYLHLLVNDQHRKLANHFENIDLHRLEFQLPFFDSSFLEFIFSIPIENCLKHQLCVKWLSLFSPAVTSVPWQVYPGHEPCPVSVPEGLSYQWSNKYQSAEHAARKRLVMGKASELLHSSDFPKAILNKRNLRVAAMIHATGLRDYQYLIGPAHAYHSYWQKCSGKYVL
jgi:asparagine synthase (glutamine-hydrolysing)